MEKKNLNVSGIRKSATTILTMAVLLLVSLAYFAFTKPTAKQAQDVLETNSSEELQEVPKKLYVITFPSLDKGKTTVSFVIDSINGSNYTFTRDNTSKNVSKYDASGRNLTTYRLGKADPQSFDDFIVAHMKSTTDIVALDNHPMGGISSACKILLDKMKDIWKVNSLVSGCIAALCAYSDCAEANGKDKCSGNQEVACASCSKDMNCSLDRAIIIDVFEAKRPKVIKGH